MEAFHKAFDIIGTMTGRSACGLRCGFCDNPCEDQWKFCNQCGYPLKLSTACLSTVAPESLIHFAKKWHTGTLSALHNVQGGRILHRNLLRLIQELKEIITEPGVVARGPDFPETIQGHIKALEYLHGQQ